MTPAEEALIEALLARTYSNASDDDEIKAQIPDLVEAVRQERLPTELFDAVLALETRYQVELKQYRGEANDFTLNYPEETVDAAFSKARKQLRDGNR